MNSKSINLNSKLQQLRFLSRKTIKKSKKITKKPKKIIEKEEYQSSLESYETEPSVSITTNVSISNSDTVVDLSSRLKIVGASNEHRLLFLKSHERVVVEGSFQFKLLRGCIDVLGFTLNRENTADSLLRFSSLPPHNLLQIIVESPDEKLDLQEYKSHCSRALVGIFPPEEIREVTSYDETIEDDYSQYSCVLAIILDRTGIPIRIWPSAQGDAQFITLTIPGKQIINNMIGYQESFPKNIGMKKIIVVGDRNTGKSTYCILLMNSLLSNIKNSVHPFIHKTNEAERTVSSGVCLLECDLGQGMFYPPGNITLHKFTRPPAFSNLSEHIIVAPQLKFFLGEFSPENNPKEYLQAVKQCIEYHRSFYSDCPLIINTHGYVTNLGENLIYDLIRVTEPYFVVNLKAEEGMGRLGYSQGLGSMNKVEKRISFLPGDSEMPLFEQNPSSKQMPHPKKIRWPKHIFTLDSTRIGKQNAHYNFYKKHRKDAFIMQYLRENKSLENRLPFVENFKKRPLIELSMMEPFGLVVNEFKFFLMKEGSILPVLDRQSIMSVFIGSVVALYCARKGQEAESLSTCSEYGFGFVADFDRNKGIAYVSTPLELEYVQRVNCIVKSVSFDFSKKFYGQGVSGMWEIKELLESMASTPKSDRRLESKGLPFFLDNITTESKVIGADPFQAKLSVRKYQK